MEFLKGRVALAWEGCRSLKKLFCIVLVAFVLLVAIAHIGFTVHYGGNPQVLTDDMQGISSMLEEKDVITDEGNLSGWAIFGNNARVAALGLVLGFIPFLFLPALLLLSNAVVLGMVTAASMLLMDNPVFLAAAILPHGIIELPILLLALCMGLSICAGLIKLILGHCTAREFFHRVEASIWAFVLFVLPLLGAAALLETYVTPWVAMLTI